MLSVLCSEGRLLPWVIRDMKTDRNLPRSHFVAWQMETGVCLSLTSSSKGMGGTVGSSRNISSQSRAFIQRARLSTSLAIGPSVPVTARMKVLSLQADGMVLAQSLVGVQHGRVSIRPGNCRQLKPAESPESISS